jgi:molybdopterin-guanine dinucleotide biosynthesis protein B
VTRAIAVIGSGRESGKTTTVEALVRELSSRGYKVGTIKQIKKEDFTIDTPEKDTWRHTEAGAKIVVSSAPHEVAAIKRVEDKNRFAQSMRFLDGEDLDVILIEGNPPEDMPRIFVTSDPERIEKLPESIKDSIICISAMTTEKFEGAELNIPVFNPNKDAKKIVDFLKRHVFK